MVRLEQTPRPGEHLLACAGDILEVTLRLAPGDARPGAALFRTNLGQAAMRRHEIIALTESGEPPLARDWHDLPMTLSAPSVFTVRVPLLDVGWFAGKTCFLPKASSTPEWPDGENLVIKVEPAHTACANTIYTAFVRQFGPAVQHDPRTAAQHRIETQLDAQGYTVIPPSGTFRDLTRHLDTILDGMHFRIIQLLPIHPTPTTYARMGRFGSPFAGLDFLSVDPALAEFDPHATPIDQFRELVDAIHARDAHIFLDIPANHTGWSSTLQIHHPEWFRRTADGTFASPGAWGVTWEDLVELDYRHPDLRACMADVFLFWARQGVDGFRCDAGYMIPAETWTYIVARVRSEFPDTVFLLEGLGGKISVTTQLLSESNLNWAYSEIFQTYDRAGMENYLPSAIALGDRTGPLVHYAETHDNARLAASGETYARMRTALAALLSQQGAFGISNGVEWFATQKIDVHEASTLNWDAKSNQIVEISRLNTLLATHPAFAVGASIRFVQEKEGNSLAVVRRAPNGATVLVLINLDASRPQPVHWQASSFDAPHVWDLLTGAEIHLEHHRFHLAPGQALCFTATADDLKTLTDALEHPTHEPAAILRRRRNLAALRVRRWLTGKLTVEHGDADADGDALARNPQTFCATAAGIARPRVTTWNWPDDTHRTVMIPPDHLLLVRAPHPFHARLTADGRVTAGDASIPDANNGHVMLLNVASAVATHRLELSIRVFTPSGATHACTTEVLALAPGANTRVAARFTGLTVRRDPDLRTILGNGRGAMTHACAAWGEIRSQYDALLAINADPRVPVDRRVFFTRCRAWLRYCGYSHAIDATCLESFESDPGGTSALWRFKVPVGVGRWVEIAFRLRLVHGHNRLRFEIHRMRGTDGLADSEAITVVLRPDIEWRSFHEKTKAYAGPEQNWPSAIHVESNGFTFHPAHDEKCAIRVEHGAFHHEPQWSYMVAHPDDAIRGLDGSSDLYSPGWFDVELSGGSHAVLHAEREDHWTEEKAHDTTLPESGIPMQLPAALRRAINLYVVRRDDLLTIIAGYPWFLDWGRDTLIVLRGIIAAERADDALRILREFGRFEKQGTLPNMIRGNDDSNRDTTDAPLWFGGATADLISVLDAKTVLNAPCGDRPLRDVLVSIATHYRDGTPNGIRMDRASALIYSPPHFTWMDTNFPAATPREGYPVEIQALWIAFLELLAKHVDPSWQTLATQARRSLAKLFWLPQEQYLADNLRAKPGTSAANATPEDALRPNQLLALTLAVFDGDLERQSRILQACETLLVPGGIRSLADRPVRVEQPVWRDGRLLNDPARPYRGRYEGDEDTSRKPAYHNGTAWTWQFPLYSEALVKVYGDEARATALALLGSATAVINAGCVGQVPEILDGDAPHTPRGCGAQAWGVSELLRVWKSVSQS